MLPPDTTTSGTAHRNYPVDAVEAVPRSDIQTEFLRRAELLPAFEFAKLIGVLPSTEASMRSRGNVPPHFKRGGQVFYRFEDVKAWLTENPRAHGDRRGRRADVALADSILRP